MKHTSLLLGKRASGTIGGEITASNWKGVPVLKTPSIPTYTNTAAQSAVRTDFQTLVAYWQGTTFSASDKAAFNKAATRSGKAQSGYNYFIGQYRKALALGDDPVYCHTVSAAVTPPNLVISASVTEDIDCIAKLYSNTMVFLGQYTGTAAGGSLTINAPTSDLTDTGFYELDHSEAGYLMKSGLYGFSLT